MTYDEKLSALRGGASRGSSAGWPWSGDGPSVRGCSGGRRATVRRPGWALPSARLRLSGKRIGQWRGAGPVRGRPRLAGGGVRSWSGGLEGGGVPSTCGAEREGHRSDGPWPQDHGPSTSRTFRSFVGTSPRVLENCPARIRLTPYPGFSNSHLRVAPTAIVSVWVCWGVGRSKAPLHSRVRAKRVAKGGEGAGIRRTGMWTVWPLLGSNGLNGRIPPGEARAPKPESPVLFSWRLLPRARFKEPTYPI